MHVNVLVTIPQPDIFESCTLCFKSLRVGFPTAKITLYLNDKLSLAGPMYRAREIAPPGCEIVRLTQPIHHATWIHSVLSDHKFAEGPCVIADPDTIFWKSCEEWSFDTSIAGYYVPLMWNDFSQCVSFERLHTSLLWVQDVEKMFDEIERAYPPAKEPTGDYCPANPFMPRVQFIKGIPFFWDSTAALYNMIGGTHFGESHLACYDHLNSASFYDVMHERLENKDGFEFLHKTLVKTPEQLRGLWQVVHPYYAAKHQQALAFLESAKQFGPPGLRSLSPILT